MHKERRCVEGTSESSADTSIVLAIEKLLDAMVNGDVLTVHQNYDGIPNFRDK